MKRANTIVNTGDGVNLENVERFLDLVDLENLKDNQTDSQYGKIPPASSKSTNRRQKAKFLKDKRKKQKFYDKAVNEVYIHTKAQKENSERENKDYSSELLDCIDDSIKTMRPAHIVLGSIFILLVACKFILAGNMIRFVEHGPSQYGNFAGLVYAGLCFYDLAQHMRFKGYLSRGADLALDARSTVTKSQLDDYRKNRLKSWYYGSAVLDMVFIALMLWEAYAHFIGPSGLQSIF